MAKKQNEVDTITIKLSLNGKETETKIKSILEYFRGLDIDPLKIKTQVVFEVIYNGSIKRKALKPFQMKRLLVNDNTRQIIAKQLNNAVGLILTYS